MLLDIKRESRHGFSECKIKNRYIVSFQLSELISHNKEYWIHIAYYEQEISSGKTSIFKDHTSVLNSQWLEDFSPLLTYNFLPCTFRSPWIISV